MNLKNRNRLMNLENELIIAGEGMGEGIVGEFEIDMYTRMYLKWIINKDLLYSTGNPPQCYVAAWMGGEFGGEYKCVAESLHCSPEAITTMLIGYSSKQNKKFKYKKKALQRSRKHYILNNYNYKEKNNKMIARKKEKKETSLRGLGEDGSMYDVAAARPVRGLCSGQGACAPLSTQERSKRLLFLGGCQRLLLGEQAGTSRSGVS